MEYLCVNWGKFEGEEEKRVGNREGERGRDGGMERERERERERGKGREGERERFIANCV